MLNAASATKGWRSAYASEFPLVIQLQFCFKESVLVAVYSGYLLCGSYLWRWVTKKYRPVYNSLSLKMTLLSKEKNTETSAAFAVICHWPSCSRSSFVLFYIILYSPTIKKGLKPSWREIPNTENNYESPGRTRLSLISFCQCMKF